MIVSRWILLRRRNISDKSFKENQNKSFMFNIFFWKSCRLWDNVDKYGTARQTTNDNIIRRMRIACWITKATDTHSECVILNCVSTATNVKRTRLNITLYVHCLSRFFRDATAQLGPGRLMAEVSTSHTVGHTKTLGRTPLNEWSAVAEDDTYTAHNKHKRRTSMPSAGFETAIPAIKTYALGCEVTGIGTCLVI
jgi:hypothetical protein